MAVLDGDITLGTGAYTIRDVSEILHIPYAPLSRWVRKYWGGSGKDTILTFRTLIELSVFYRLTHQGVSVQKVKKAHEVLSEAYHTDFPFAHRKALARMQTDGKKLFFKREDSFLSLDKTNQLVLSFIEAFLDKIDFDEDLFAKRYYPMGRDRSVVADPHHQFGQPVIKGTNIKVESIYSMFKAHEPVRFIAWVYEINPSQVEDAIEYCKRAA